MSLGAGPVRAAGTSCSASTPQNCVGIGFTDGRGDGHVVPFSATTSTDSQADTVTDMSRRWLFQACSGGPVGSASINATSTRAFSSFPAAPPPFTAGPAAIPSAGAPNGCVRTTQSEEAAYAFDMLAPGFTSSRTVSPLVIPAGSTTIQTMTVSFTVDANATDGPYVGMNLVLDTNSNFAASALWTYVSAVASDASTPSINVAAGPGPAGHLQIVVASPVVGTTYTLTFQGTIANTNPGVPDVVYKPRILVQAVNVTGPTQTTYASSFSVYDPVLQGTASLSLDQTYFIGYTPAITFGVDYQSGYDASPVVPGTLSLAVTTPSPVAVDTADPLPNSFTDSGGSSPVDSSYTCYITWGDTSSPTVVTMWSANTPPGGTWSCVGANGQPPSHPYAAAGVYTVTVTVVDSDGSSASASVLAVVYDPSAGFVTGGGWITSPPGAYVASPDLSGRANFGFVSAYKRGATIPTGETEFQFRLAGFDFHSDAYQWLVVSGAKAQYKGTGEVNGVIGYGFLLTALDGDLLSNPTTDGFRIKIWNSAGVVYDNVSGTSDDLTSGTEPLGGGDIVIHTH